MCLLLLFLLYSERNHKVTKDLFFFFFFLSIPTMNERQSLDWSNVNFSHHFFHLLGACLLPEAIVPNNRKWWWKVTQKKYVYCVFYTISSIVFWGGSQEWWAGRHSICLVVEAVTALKRSRHTWTLPDSWSRRYRRQRRTEEETSRVTRDGPRAWQGYSLSNALEKQHAGEEAKKPRSCWRREIKDVRQKEKQTG